MLLPLRVLYLKSNFFYFILFHIAGYRKNVVLDNLRNSFPEKSDEEIKNITKKYYLHLCDMFIETFKSIHLTEKQIKKRVEIKNIEVLDELYAKNKSVIAVLGHYGNWEWLFGLPLATKYKVLAIHKPIQNRCFNTLTNKIRSKFGIEMITMKGAFKSILNYQKKNELTLTYFLSDQTPVKEDINFWTNFLNQDTPVFLGAERIAKKTNQAVVFFNIKKIKRGYYSLEIEKLFDEPNQTSEHEITEKHVQTLEKHIKKEPAYWLWSHRRWKHKRVS